MKVLVVDDDEFFRKVYASKLKAEGFEVSTASNGEEALKSVSEEKPDLILLDLIMPQKDGFEVLEDMGKDPDLKKIPVVIFSTLEQKEDVDRAMELGAADYINKSEVNVDDLKSKLSKLLKGG